MFQRSESQKAARRTPEARAKHATQMREWRAANYEKHLAYAAAWRAVHPEKSKADADHWAALALGRPEMRKAKAKVWTELRAGRLVRPEICEECGGNRGKGKIEAAHYTYDEPLKLRWLCRPCHVSWDQTR